jgi:hypothetical protein
LLFFCASSIVFAMQVYRSALQIFPKVLITPRMCAPIPFEPVLEHDARTSVSEIEASPNIHLEFIPHLPVPTTEQLVHFRLSVFP